MGFWDWLFGLLEWLGLRNKKGRLLLLGLDNAGKTTLLQCLKTGQVLQYDQTKSYHVEDLVIEKIRFQAFDLGGHELARQSWSDYYVDASAVVFIVDSADIARFNEAREQLESLLNDPALRGVPFLILGNKIDLPTAVGSADQLAQSLGILNQTDINATSVPPDQHPLRIFMCSVFKKTGYAQGFQWLAKFIP